MARKHQYLLRQDILRSLHNVYPAGKDAPKLAADPDVAPKLVTADDVLAEARVLESAGLIKDVRGPGRTPYWKLTALGMAQIDGSAALLEVVWGDAAL